MALVGDLDPLFVGTVVVYFLIVLGIGVYGYLKTENEADFLVAGREIGPIVGGATLSATQMSAGTLVGTFGVHYLLGVSFIWIWPGLWAGWIVSLLLVAPQMRRFGEMTVPDFIAARYRDDGADGDYVRAIGAVLIILAYTVYISAQYTAGGIVFQALIGTQQEVGMLIMMITAIGYTAVGGMRASALTDFLQAVVMATGVVIAIPLAMHFIGGFGVLNALFESANPTMVGPALSTVEIVGFMAAFGFSMAAAPFEIVRIYSMKDEKTVRQAIGITLIFQAVIGTSVALLGVSMRAMFPQLTTPDLASVIMSLEVLGPVLGALLISAVFSAILSTVDSVMIVSASGVAHDIYAKIINEEASEHKKVWANRIAVLVLGFIPFVLALYGEALGGLVQFIVVLQASMIGGMFFMPLVLGLHWRRANTWGGLGGMVLGLVTVILWHVGTEVYSFVPENLAQWDPVIPGVIVSLLAVVTISYATGKPSPKSVRPFFETRETEEPPEGPGVAGGGDDD